MKNLYILFLFVLTITSCQQSKETPIHYYKWDVVACNQVGCNHYECDSYKQTDNTYYLYCSDTLTTQITVTAGIAVIISKN